MYSSSLGLIAVNISSTHRLLWKIFVFLACAVASLSISSAARAFLDPPPDGGYLGQNTAEGENALHSLTDGIANTAIGMNSLFFNSTGGQNTATGASALAFNTTGNDNTAIGFQALQSNTSGPENTAVGFDALASNTTAPDNTATGFQALFSNTTGADNTASGWQALATNTIGKNNTAAGSGALANNKAGASNVALGFNAGVNLTSGSNNIDLGANVLGLAGEANTIRIGKQGTQKSTFVAGIFGTPVTGSTVVVNSTGKLGVATSSARFKEAIKPMDKASEAIFALKPVTFLYREEIDPDKIPQFGLVAEEVQKVNPDLVVRDEDGKVNTVRYEAVNAMLLNEFLKEHRKIEEQARDIEQMKRQIESLTVSMRKASHRSEVGKNSRLPVLANDR